MVRIRDTCRQVAGCLERRRNFQGWRDKAFLERSVVTSERDSLGRRMTSKVLWDGLKCVCVSGGFLKSSVVVAVAVKSESVND